MSEVTPKPKPVLHRISDAYFILECEAEGLHFHAQRVSRNRYGELRCTLEVTSAIAGVAVLDEDRYVLNRWDNVNLSTASGRKGIAADLERMVKTRGQANWHSLIDALYYEVGRAEQVGQPALVLSRVERHTADPMFDLDGFRLLSKHPTILFGDGGSMKSYLALYWAGRLMQMGRRVGYFDWEQSVTDHRERAERLFSQHVPDVVYVPCSRPLIYEIDRLVQIKHDHSLDYAVFDSVAFACQGKPEDAENASAYNRAVRQLEIGSLHIAHITKGENGDQRPFGSAFWHNQARATWFAKAEAPAESNTKTRTIGLHNRKVNFGPYLPPVGFQFTFEPDRTQIQRVDLADVETLAEDLPLWQRIKPLVKHRPVPLAELAEELGANIKSIEKAVRRRSGLFALVPGTDGITRVGLLERRAS